MGDWRCEYTSEAERDLGLIFDHLFAAYQSLGEPEAEAFAHAAERIRAIKAAGDAIAAAPFRGTRHDDILPGLRHVTIDRAVYWFDHSAARQTVRILAVFFGGQDHIRHMLVRLLGD